MPRIDLKPEERLIVAADFVAPEGESNAIDWVANQVLELAGELENTGCVIKVNSILRADGYRLIEQIRECGLNIFGDLKVIDISETLKNDAALLQQYKPELLTVMCSAGISGMYTLRSNLPDTEVLGVTVLTSLSEEDCNAIHGCSIKDAVGRLTGLAWEAKLGGIICAPTEIELVREIVGDEMTVNTPGVRPLWAKVKGDDQNKARVMTATEAIQIGADRIVVGRPITQAKNRREATLRTIDDIAKAA